MLKTRSNKKLLQDHIRMKSDKIVTLQDLSNYAAKLKNKSKSLEEILSNVNKNGGKLLWLVLVYIL